MYADAIVEALNTKHGNHYTFEVDPGGRKYIRIIAQTTTDNARHVYMFINATDGSFLKAAGWKTPAKGVRYAPTTETEAVNLINTKSDPYGSWLYR